ncbi:hypothetical protein [Pseudonocardia sp. GCM10023141]|uniref:hypothetical protein n=1 Tax=Pseudonocardia sp. GCM10023141 TaxID=3252653 RepID=UPI0036241F3C
MTALRESSASDHRIRCLALAVRRTQILVGSQRARVPVDDAATADATVAEPEPAAAISG